MPYTIETIIPIDMICDVRNEKTAEKINSPNVRFSKHSKYVYGVCFNFAFQDNSLYCCDYAFEKLKYNYHQIPIEQAQSGDIISYHEIESDSEYDDRKAPNKFNVLHFAKIKKTNRTLQGTIIESKWGKDGVFETNLFEVPSMYGNCIVIWRKKESVKMKYLVRCNGNLHSAWLSLEEAKKQIDVLENSGYRDVDCIQVDHNYENGHYFV